MKPTGVPKLGDVVRDVFIVAHKEDTTALEHAMALEGFNCRSIRGPYTEHQLQFPAQIRCLVNHSNAWREVKRGSGYSIVVEADFVPVRGFSSLPLPFEPRVGEKQMAWLYSVGPVIYHVDERNYALYGHNAGMVAYVLDEMVAKDWLRLYEEEMSEEEQEYRLFDVKMPIRLRRECGVKCYIPYRMYGEHGGIANPEHKRNKIRSWHEADSLAGPLHFLPAYARKHRLYFLLRRLRGRARGWYRFAMGKYFDGWPAWWRSGEDRWLRLRLALERLL